MPTRLRRTESWHRGIRLIYRCIPPVSARWESEDAIRNAISIGGDSDTIAAMTGAIAGIEYGIPRDMADFCRNKLTPDLQEILIRFENI